jgi:CRP/FNR family transcriptional regulator, nitrogen oxide reductase regulator
MPATGIAILAADAKSRLFEGIAQRDLDIIRGAATERRFLANSVITNQGNPSDHLFLITSGRARYFFITEEGEKTLLLWLTPGEIIGGAAFLARESNYLLSAEAVKDSSVLVWGRTALRSLASRHPRLLENALLMASDYLAWYFADHVALTCRTARQRLAQVLLRLAAVIGQKVPGGVEFDATNEELASAANITPFTASRLVNEWQMNRAVVKRRGKILLRSSGRLLLNAV